MAFGFRSFLNGIRFIPKPTSTVSVAGDVDFNTTDNKLHLHNGTIGSPLVTEASLPTFSPLTTKGDLLTRDATTEVRVGVGTNGQVLSADSTQSSGLKWSTVTGTGTVTSITADAATGLTGGTITTSGTIGIGVVPIANGGTNTTSFTNKSIPYFNGTSLTENNTNLFWNNTDLTLAIGANGAPTPSGLAITISRNGLTGPVETNSNAGVGAIAGTLASNGVDFTLFGQTGANYTGFPRTAFISQFAGGNGMLFNVPAAKPIAFYQNNVLKSGITTGGDFQVETNLITRTSLKIEDPGAGTNNVTIQSPTLSSSYTLTLPVDDGTSGQVLSTDGSGILSWTANGSTPTGTVNTIAFFNASGNLSSNSKTKFNETQQTASYGNGTGTFNTTSGDSTLTVGRTVDTNCTLTNAGTGSVLFGILQSAFGNPVSSMNSNGFGSMTFGTTLGVGIITSNGSGSLAGGNANGTTILSSGTGSVALGSGNITSSFRGTIALGRTNAGSITSSGEGSLAIGFANAVSCSISSSGNGSISFGDAQGTAGIINSASSGALAGGAAVSFTITSNAFGSVALGHTLTGAITSSGNSSFTMGDDSQSTGTHTTTFGLGHRNAAYANVMIGRYGSDTGTTGSWVATDSVFQIGNGTSTGSPATAFQIFKDGKLTTTAAQTHSAVRLVTGTDTLSNRTDRTILLDLTTAGGALTLPTAATGLEYSFGFSGVGAGVYTLTGTLDTNLSSTITTPMKIIGFSGTWYRVG